eukprot:350494-Chlamydomonas_euryale.AAC.12
MEEHVEYWSVFFLAWVAYVLHVSAGLRTACAGLLTGLLMLIRMHVRGDVVTAGADAGKTPGLAADSALNCCMACKEAKGCNIWVWCSNPSSCGQQCWLKRVGQPSDIEGVRRAADAGVPWTSGVLRKDYDRSIGEWCKCSPTGLLVCMAEHDGAQGNPPSSCAACIIMHSSFNTSRCMHAYEACRVSKITIGMIQPEHSCVADADSLPPVDTTIRVVSLSTPHGVIRIRLMPDWSASSVEFVQRLAMTPDLCSNACEFYRAEPGFLLQVVLSGAGMTSACMSAAWSTLYSSECASRRVGGRHKEVEAPCSAFSGSLRAFIPPNKITTPGPKIMERGELGWAGGSAGPDFFIYLGQYPATHFGHDHTVFAVVADDESLAVVETIVQLPSEAPHPGDMHMLNAREPFSIGVAAL